MKIILAPDSFKGSLTASQVVEAISFEEQLRVADLVITGEGKTDRQTLSGKTAFGLLRLRKKNQLSLSQV